tara:strand:- start:237 stop:686 length:450 start_codon:yes stop_codon:yes gene_type:complete
MSWIEELREFVQDKINAITPTTTSAFFSSPREAREWVDSRVIIPNPRLSDIVKNRLLQESQTAFDNALSTGQFGADGVVGALQYWEAMQYAVASITGDPQLLAVFDIAVQGAQETVNLNIITDRESSPTVEIPWWLYAAAGVLIFKLIK